MCLSFLFVAPASAGAAATPYSLVLAVNRDEYYARYDTDARAPGRCNCWFQ
jgi:uncharacterized protein with NRDE domain